MKNRWNDADAAACKGNLLALRVYTSRLLGADPELVLHGGGNTSVKVREPDFFGDDVDLCYVKGSGWDLGTIEAPGFAPVRMDVLGNLAEMAELSDTDMVTQLRAAMTDPAAPTPSVEAILHAIIPFTVVDHTHANAIVAVTNSPGGKDRIREIYGDRVLIVPYVMPGFILARTVFDMTRDTDWSKLEGMVLMNHGIFSFGDDARTSYDRMIDLVAEAEAYLEAQGATGVAETGHAVEDLAGLATLRREVAKLRGAAVVARLNASAEAVGYSQLANIEEIATRGPLTPDHVIRTKRVPLMVDGDMAQAMSGYAAAYQEYFETHTDGELTCLDAAPRWAVWKGRGTVAFGASVKEADIIADINQHTMHTIQQAEALGGWVALPPKDIFDVEYWELEQAKLRKGGSAAELQGKVALVTGAASGIGAATAAALMKRGAAVVGVDINPAIAEQWTAPNQLGLVLDITRSGHIHNAVEETVRRFGGLDIVVCNAGVFHAGERIDEIDDEVWAQHLEVNLTAHRRLLGAAIPFLKLGIDPAVIVNASRNVLAPSAGAAAYSVSKAALTQLGRVAALELAPFGVRVNTVHPDAVFDTGLWTDEALEKGAKRYDLTVEQYKRRNLLGTDISSHDVANLICTLAGPVFYRTTGAQVPIDGGDARAI